MLDLPVEKWNSLLKEVYKKNSGTLEELEKIVGNLVGKDKIKTTIKALLYLDFIQLGLDIDKNTTWKATDILREEVGR
ncbi:MAG: hypothetical protein DSZ31_05060 [Gammaproteobacteria bacterium]|nr:MAG: hypothetical protein DSZ31_05060 [Gammaproteobacteria bacterium]